MNCPYCWTEHRRGDLHIRCGERCEHKGESFLARKLKKGRCPHGLPAQTGRRCPACGKALESEYLDSGGRNIAVIGSADSGKSTWVGVLVHELQRGQVNERFAGMSLSLIGDRSRDRYSREFEQPLFQDSRTVDSTRTARVLTPEPLIFSLRFKKAGLFGTTRVDPVVTVFYDTAGEDVARAESMDLLTSYLNAAEGIILLLDPVQMPKIRAMVGTTGQKTEYTEQLHVVDRLGELLRERRGASAGALLRTPIAIALTKLDLLRDTIDAQSPLRQPSRHDGVYDEADGLDVHEEIRGWLDRWYDPAFDRTVGTTFKNYRYFGLSALGAPPVDRNRLAPGGVHPYRLEEPMLWLLSRFGAIKARGKR